jgi:predicted ArsR family transcriptional regulator
VADIVVPVPPAREQRVGWTFLTNHGHVLLALARDPHARLRDVAEIVGITERAVQSIVGDLEAAGYLVRERDGRRNRYKINPDGVFRHPAERDQRVGDLLALFLGEAGLPTGPARPGG